MNAFERLNEALRDVEDVMALTYNVTADVQMESGAHLRWGKSGDAWILTTVDTGGEHPLLKASAARRIEAPRFLDLLRAKLDECMSRREAEVVGAIETALAFTASLREGNRRSREARGVES